MDKLLELLNEYGKSGLNEFEKYEEWWYCKWNGKILRGNWENDNELTPYELCSKQYGFIKWLVDNDKIDLLQLDNRIALSEFNKCERVLMALSIQDNPIEFLISVLR